MHASSAAKLGPLQSRFTSERPAMMRSSIHRMDRVVFQNMGSELRSLSRLPKASKPALRPKATSAHVNSIACDAFGASRSGIAVGASSVARVNHLQNPC